ncbi:MAG: hypothetical protein ACR2F2_02590 [Pyrinomonadaceae bacterium]
MSILDRHFQELQMSGELVEIFREHTEANSARLCRINAISDFAVYTTNFNDGGEYDGIMIFRKDDITRVRWGDNELEAQRVLVERTKEIPVAPEINLEDIVKIIESVQQQFGYVSIATEELNDEVIYIGEVVSVDKDFLVLNEYGFKDALDRSMLILRIPEVTRIDADDKYQKTILYLHTQSKKSLDSNGKQRLS